MCRQAKQLKKRKRGDDEGKLVEHGFRCKQGWHMSVAATELLASAFRSDGFFVTVAHVEESVKSCGCPRECIYLEGNECWTPDKQAAVQANWAADGAAAHSVASRLYALY